MTSPLPSILAQIREAHSSPDNESLTESAIISSVTHLISLPSTIHWLCHSSPYFPVLVQAIQLWGYGEPPAQATLEKFKPLLSYAINKCADCAIEWHSGFRTELRRVFREVYSYDDYSTAEFYATVEDWDRQRLVGGLRTARTVAQKLPMGWKHVEVQVPLVEGLADGMLLMKMEVLDLWREVFLSLERLPAEVGEVWLPGAVVLLFDSETRIKDFGEQMFSMLGDKLSVTDFERIRKPLQHLIQQYSGKVCLTLSC
jgi:SEN1 N terminal